MYLATQFWNQNVETTRAYTQCDHYVLYDYCHHVNMFVVFYCCHISRSVTVTCSQK